MKVINTVKLTRHLCVFINQVFMSVMIIHIVVSLLIALGFLGAFIWAIRTNQYDDDYSPSVRMLFDDQKPNKQNL